MTFVSVSYLFPWYFFQSKVKRDGGRGGGRGTVLMAEKYLLFNLLNIQRDVTEKE